jgi:hypothetical protein
VSLIPQLKLALFAVVASSTLLACASSEYRMGTETTDWYEQSNADPASFGITDAFTFNKKQKARAPNDFQFYYKRCALDGGRTHYSRTSYWCTDPF